jgi:tetratricopeptide (TPR) repeat protein
MYYSDKALALEPDSADALTATALRKLFYDHDWVTADAYFNRALELRPGYAGVHYLYSDFLIANGRASEARKEIALALELDPLSLNVITASGRPDFYARNYDAAIKQYLTAVEMDPNFMPARLWIGRAYTAKHDYARALESLRMAEAAAPDSLMVRASIAQALALSGRKAEARKMRAELEALDKTRYVSPYDLAALDVALGETSRALEHLQAAYDERSYHIVFARMDPAFDAIAEEPRFQALVRRVSRPDR